MDRDLLLDDIKKSISKRKEQLFNKIPIVHTISDGIVIRFFYGWSDNEEDTIKYIDIHNEDESKNKSFYFFLPKGSVFDVEADNYIDELICLEGKLQLNYNNNIKTLNSFTKFNIPKNTKHYGIALENTYLVISSKQSEGKDIIKQQN